MQTCFAGRQLSKNIEDHTLVKGGARVRTPSPLENYKAIKSLSDSGPDLLENQNATKSAVNVGTSSPTRDTPFKCRFASGQIMTRF